MTDDDVLNAMTSMAETPAEQQQTEQQQTEQQVQQTNESDVYVLNLTKDDFIKFTNALALIQNICGDCDINSGKIRCRTDDHHNLIMMDLSSILGDKNISFSGLKKKLSQLSVFNLSTDNSAESSFLIEATTDTFKFSDSISKLETRKSRREYLNNTYVEDEEFSNIRNSVDREDALLFEASIDSIEKKRLAKLGEIFGVNDITFEFNGDGCTYHITTTSKDNVFKTTKTVPLKQNLTGVKTLVNNFAFVLDTPSNLDISCYSDGSEYCMFKFKLNYYGLPIEIITKTRVSSSIED